MTNEKLRDIFFLKHTFYSAIISPAANDTTMAVALFTISWLADRVRDIGKESRTVNSNVA